MPGNKIPQTLVKLSQSLMLLGYHQVDDTGNPFNTSGFASIAETLVSFKTIGFTHRFRVNQDRDNHPRRGINASVEAFATTPGAIRTTIEMEKTVLNTEDAMGAFQFLPGNIAFQTRPLVIIEVTIPAIDDNNVPIVQATLNRGLSTLNDKILGLPGALLGTALTAADLATSPVYMGCWLASSSKEFKLEGSQAVMQNVTLNVSRVTPAITVVFPDTAETIIESLPVVTRGVQIARSIGRAVQ